MSNENATINFLGTGEQMLPFRCLVLAPIASTVDWTNDVEPIQISLANFDHVMKQFAPTVVLNVESQILCAFLDVEEQALTVSMTFNSIASFSPVSIVENDPVLSDLASCLDTVQNLLQEPVFDDHLYSDLTRSLNSYFHHSIYQGRTGAETFVLDIQATLNSILNQLLHDSLWQQLEQTWRSLYWLCQEQAECRHCLIDLFPVSKEQLWDDYSHSADIVDSELYHLLYTKNYGQFGATPYSTLLLDDYFNILGSDLSILKRIAEIAASAHVPIISGISPKAFGLNSFEELSEIEDLHEIHNGIKHIKWRNFIASDVASYIVLTMPRIRIRPIYDKQLASTDSFDWFNESFSGPKDYIWANASYGFVINLMKSFSQHGFCSSIIGEHPGQVEFHKFNAHSLQLPLEVTLPQKKDAAIINLGINPINIRNQGSEMYFKSANSVRWGHVSQVRKQQTHDSLASAQLSYLMIVLRIVHCLKILFRERIGSYDSTAEIQNYLNNWLRQFVSAVNVPSETLRATRPLKEASVLIETKENQGRYDVQLLLQPHLKFLGENINVDFAISIQEAIE